MAVEPGNFGGYFLHLLLVSQEFQVKSQALTHATSEEVARPITVELVTSKSA